jgi:hypothetical protein
MEIDINLPEPSLTLLDFAFTTLLRPVTAASLFSGYCCVYCYGLISVHSSHIILDLQEHNTFLADRAYHLFTEGYGTCQK